MATTVAEEYAKIRRKHEWLPSKQAILWARGNMKPLELEWDTFVGSHLAVGKGTRDGFDIRVTVDQSDEVTSQYDETDKDTGIRNPNFVWTGDEYGSRRHERFIELESESTVRDLAKEYAKYGDARNVAWERARASLQEEADNIIKGDEVECIFRVTASIKGAKLGTAVCGSTMLLDYGQQMERDCDNGVIEMGLIDEAIVEAREAAKALREALDNLVPV